MKIYCVYDKTAQIYGTPFFQPTDVVALRSFKNEVNRASDANAIYLNPEDFSLHCLGEFNNLDGHIEVHSPVLLSQAVALIPKEK